MTETLHVATYNIHKGFSNFNRRMVVHELRDRLRNLGADVVFLQEVQGGHSRHGTRFADWPEEPQYEFLADSVWKDFAYGRNAVYDSGHHGNAMLSRYPIVRWENKDISTHALESRGLLHCEIEVEGWRSMLHCVCVHLGLTNRGRRTQLVVVDLIAQLPFNLLDLRTGYVRLRELFLALENQELVRGSRRERCSPCGIVSPHKRALIAIRIS